VLLEIKGLQVRYSDIEVVRGVDLEIDKGECIGLVGESGCGKTTVGLSITRLIPRRKGDINAGRILFEGQDLLTLSDEELRKYRGSRISYVFQEPFSSLNPVFTIYEQLKEVLPEDDDAERSISEALKSVGLQELIDRKKVYPHELSGGMQQRAMIAMAIISRPDLLVLDEPTTALDVTVQKKILELVMELKKSLGLSILFISHDLRTVFELADRVCVMYAGRIVEQGAAKTLMSRPGHPYTKGLVNSIPSIEHRKQRFNAIEGRTPLFSELPEGCKFYPRCKFRIKPCSEKEPFLGKFSEGHYSRCIRSKELIAHGTVKDI